MLHYSFWQSNFDVVFATVCESAASELNQLRSFQQVLMEEKQNLTDLTNKLSSNYENLTIQFNNLTAASAALKNNISTLTEENYNLTSLNKKLREERENMEKTWKELNVSRAQWSIDEYCPKESDGTYKVICAKLHYYVQK